MNNYVYFISTFKKAKMAAAKAVIAKIHIHKGSGEKKLSEADGFWYVGLLFIGSL